jgi:hypothetical protein
MTFTYHTQATSLLPVLMKYIISGSRDDIIVHPVTMLMIEAKNIYHFSEAPIYYSEILLFHLIHHLQKQNSHHQSLSILHNTIKIISLPLANLLSSRS